MSYVSFILILTVKTALKSVDFQEVTDKNKLAPFFMAHGVYPAVDIHKATQ